MIGGRGRSRSTDFQPRLALQKDRLRAVFLLSQQKNAAPYRWATSAGEK
jgi:hypothetical protein